MIATVGRPCCFLTLGCHRLDSEVSLERLTPVAPTPVKRTGIGCHYSSSHIKLGTCCVTMGEITARQQPRRIDGIAFELSFKFLTLDSKFGVPLYYRAAVQALELYSSFRISRLCHALVSVVIITCCLGRTGRIQQAGRGSRKRSTISCNLL